MSLHFHSCNQMHRVGIGFTDRLFQGQIVALRLAFWPSERVATMPGVLTLCPDDQNESDSRHLSLSWAQSDVEKCCWFHNLHKSQALIWVLPKSLLSKSLTSHFYSASRTLDSPEVHPLWCSKTNPWTRISHDMEQTWIPRCLLVYVSSWQQGIVQLIYSFCAGRLLFLLLNKDKLLHSQG